MFPDIPCRSYETAFSKLGASIQNTIIIPLLALIIVVLLAVLIAYLAVRRRNALTNTVDILSMVPYIVPGTVLGIALLSSFNRRPLLLIGTMLIMVIALVIRRAAIYHPFFGGDFTANPA